ncbi:hypothetical protein COCOR_05965 [Corallococcus coralloides DSM 2259]|uniref:Uncharacterized protein n=1 Tax=Corallococcus coralloides (strain ATCC 25202 / DSM 2259 / NBRC 100086 / M2) TaxID=1144275 RepID=H8MJN1_CORCM|nr:hypothetical protein [Corallococcus coralloides]AFE06679.1 hypothetical protein COCOR_05965 [Corallococcus coralloides DSM 2259]
MAGVKAVGGSNAAKVDPAEAQRLAEAARQKAEAARLAAEAKRKAATEARDTLAKARLGADAARRQKATAEKAAANARKAAQKPGQTPEEAKKSKEALAAAEKKLKEANEASRTAAQNLQKAEEQAALAARSAEQAMHKANALALEECKPAPYSQKDIDKVKPTKNELDSAFEGTNRKAELEKVLGLTPPPQQEVIQTSGEGGAPGVPLDPKYSDTKDTFKGPFGQTSANTWVQERQGAPLGDAAHSPLPGGTALPSTPDGSDTPPVTPKP